MSPGLSLAGTSQGRPRNGGRKVVLGMFLDGGPDFGFHRPF